MSLFRNDAVVKQHQKIYGSILLIQPISQRLLTMSCFSVTVLVIFFLFFGSYTSRISLSGVLLPQNGFIPVLAMAEDALIENKIIEGQNVKRGETLFQLKSIGRTGQPDTQIAAPVDGTVSAIVMPSGGIAKSHQVLARILAVGEQLEGELYAPASEIGAIHLGAPVKIRFQAFPYQKYGVYDGQIKSISGMTISSQEVNLANGAQPAKGVYYRIRISLNSPTTTHLALKPGMVVDVEVLLERRRLYEWIVEPIVTLSEKI